MRRILIMLASLAALAISVFGASAFGATQQGNGQEVYDGGSVRGLERALSRYLNGDEIKSVLTPGEFVEWKLNLKAGQVVIAEARSDAFDPALQIVDDKNQVVAFNDDRYPGDQRPLVFWRCERDGAYAIHVRSFHDKLGGQFFVRFKTYDSIDVGPGQKVDMAVEAGVPFLLRVSMAAGEIKEFVSEFPGDRNYWGYHVVQFVAPDGLPDINLSRQLRAVTENPLLLAPVAGDYYAYCLTNGYQGHGTVRAFTRELIPRKLAAEGEGESGEAPTNLPALWELPVKAGQLLQVSTPGISLDTYLGATEAPDISGYDMSKDGSNPFYPLTKPPADKGPLLSGLPGRARDNRINVFAVRRDATLWIASNGAGPADQQFRLLVQPAAQTLAVDSAAAGKLTLGKTDYWAFDAAPGDVMTLSTTTGAFTPVIVVRNPDLGELRHDTAGPDQTQDDWRMVVQQPGRYLEAISAMGDGGGGEYAISRRVIHPKEFGLSSPAKADISDGEVQVWKFSVQPDAPLLLHWTSTSWSYGISVYDDKGNLADFQRQDVDAHDKFGIIKVSRPQTFVVVLSGTKEKASYSIELGPIPGLKK
jgi:hypothetical protein